MSLTQAHTRRSHEGVGGFEYTHQCHLFFGRAIEGRAWWSSYAFDEAHMHSMKRGIETMTYWLSTGTKHFPNQWTQSMWRTLSNNLDSCSRVSWSHTALPGTGPSPWQSPSVRPRRSPRRQYPRMCWRRRWETKQPAHLWSWSRSSFGGIARPCAFNIKNQSIGSYT